MAVWQEHRSQTALEKLSVIETTLPTVTAKLISKLANSRLSVPLRKALRRVRETYYSVEVLTRVVTKTAPLALDVRDDVDQRVNIIIPEINFDNFYGGYIAKFNLARRLAEAGRKVRLIVVDQCDMDLPAWRRSISKYSGLETIFDTVEVAYHFDRRIPLIVHSNDLMLATTWWTAFIAEAAIGYTARSEFIYLIQEYEPFTFPMGSYYALARASYDFPHKAIFSTELLRKYFRRYKIGSNCAGGDQRVDDTISFQNAIINYRPEELTLVERKPHRLLFYARPESHAARNMFEIGYQALVKAIETRIFDDEWEFHGIGSSHGDIPLPRGKRLKMLGKVDLQRYRELLKHYDIGLSLMYTPHPSLLPLEMAAAGIVVVSNECLNKTREDLTAISSNIIAGHPTISGVLDSLGDARRCVTNTQARLAGAQVRWATSWDQSFDGHFMNVVNKWIG